MINLSQTEKVEYAKAILKLDAFLNGTFEDARIELAGMEGDIAFNGAEYSLDEQARVHAAFDAVRQRRLTGVLIFFGHSVSRCSHTESKNGND